MIVRIQGEGQYELAGKDLQRLDKMDDAMLEAMEAEDEIAFRETLAAVLTHIRGNGRRLADTELRQSDLIIPPGDINLAQARALLADYPRELQER